MNVCACVCVYEKAKEILVKMKKHFAVFFSSVVVDVVKHLKERVDRKKKKKKRRKVRCTVSITCVCMSKRLLFIFVLLLCRLHLKTKDKNLLVQEQMLEICIRTKPFFFLLKYKTNIQSNVNYVLLDINLNLYLKYKKDRKNVTLIFLFKEKKILFLMLLN